MIDSKRFHNLAIKYVSGLRFWSAFLNMSEGSEHTTTCASHEA